MEILQQMTNINSTCFDFLKMIGENNNREWFEENKPWFQKEKKHIKSFFESVKEGMNSFDKIESFKMFRIYRDVRFSLDKTPYKTHFSARYMRDGVDRRGGYYLHIKPGECFIGGGFFAPEKEDLLRIRQELEMDDSEMREIMAEQKFKKRFKLKGDELKTAPKGFDKSHPAIDLIKKKQYIFTCSYSDKEVLSENFYKKVLADFELLLPFFNYMSEVLTTDLNGEYILKE